MQSDYQRFEDQLRCELRTTLRRWDAYKLYLEANLAESTVQRFLSGHKIQRMTYLKLWYWAGRHAADDELRRYADTQWVPLTAKEHDIERFPNQSGASMYPQCAKKPAAS
jgi:hypothetical protein